MNNLFITARVLFLTLQITEKDAIISAKDTLLSHKDDLLRGTRKTIDCHAKKISTVRMPESHKQREVFVAFVKASENLIVPIRRKEICMPPREKELGKMGFVPANIEVSNVPNTRYLWSNALRVMKKRRLISRWPIYNEETTRHIHAYKLVPDMCMEGVIAELKCSHSEGEWLKALTASAGRIPRSQTLMDRYMRPKNDQVVDESEVQMCRVHDATIA